MQNYIINDKTLWLEIKENKVFINEINYRKIISDINLEQVINNSCLFYGSSLTGRKKGSQSLLGEMYKIPIIIKENKCLIAFPIASNKNKRNIWFIYNNIKEYHQISKSKILIEFINGSKEIFYTSYYKFNQQILRSSRLYVIYNSRNG